MTAKKKKPKFKRHPRFSEAVVIGFVTAQGEVRAEIQYLNDAHRNDHSAITTDPTYKTWTWRPSVGLDPSIRCTRELTPEDWEMVRNWLFRRGLLNRWELE